MILSLSKKMDKKVLPVCRQLNQIILTLLVVTHTIKQQLSSDIYAACLKEIAKCPHFSTI
jgi:hypothetical protein